MRVLYRWKCLTKANEVKCICHAGEPALGLPSTPAVVPAGTKPILTVWAHPSCRASITELLPTEMMPSRLVGWRGGGVINQDVRETAP